MMMTQKFEVGRFYFVDTCVEHWSSVGDGPNLESERRGSGVSPKWEGPGSDE